MISIEGFTAFLPTLSKLIERRQLNRFFSQMQVPREVQRQIVAPLNKLSLKVIDFEEMEPGIWEFIHSLEGRIESKTPVIAIYLYLVALHSSELGEGYQDIVWIRPRIRILAKTTDLDLNLVDACFAQPKQR